MAANMGKEGMSKDVWKLSKINKEMQSECQEFITRCNKFYHLNETCMDPDQSIR